MIGNLRVLAVITARGGSKGLPRKNILPLLGRPLIAWTVEAARASRYLDRIVLSSDDEQIQAAARDAGCEIPFTRPTHFALDSTSSVEVLEHALTHLPGFDLLVLLQPTSPLRQGTDIDACIERCAQEAPAVVSVVESEKSPHWMFSLEQGNRMKKILEGPPHAPPGCASGLRPQRCGVRRQGSLVPDTTLVLGTRNRRLGDAQRAFPRHRHSA